MSNKPKGLGTKLVSFKKNLNLAGIRQIFGCKLYFTLKGKKVLKIVSWENVMLKNNILKVNKKLKYIHFIKI